MRFTIPHGKVLRLAGLTSFYKNVNAGGIPNNDSLTIAIWGIALNGNGTPNYNTVGPKLFEKKIGGNDYLYKSIGFGQQFMIPLDDAEMAFTQDQEFIVSISFTGNNYAPIGYADHSTSPHSIAGRSYLSTDNGQIWSRVNDGVDGTWFMKAIFEPVNSLYAKKVIDADGNIATTNDRTPKQGWKISLFNTNNALIDSLRTDSTGTALFSALNYTIPDGNYSLIEETRNGFLNLSALNVNLSLASSSASAEFINVHGGIISGSVFNDMNSNGSRDSNENGISDWKIFLSGTKTDATFTDGNGNYLFENLPSGNYSLAEETKSGWNQTSPTSGNYSVTLSTGENSTGKNFGNVQLFSLSTSSGEHGSIAPSGTIIIRNGKDTTFSFLPNTGYSVDSVFVDENYVGFSPSYTFTNVTANHTLSVTFKKKTFTLSATAGANGTITPSSATVEYGNDTTFTITPNAGYHIVNVLVDGETSLGAVSSYTFSNITSSHTLTATFGINLYTITATANAHGTISPSGNISVAYGD